MVKKSIILCATQRCGSTMICEEIRNFEVLGNPEEYYIPWTKNNLDKYNWKNVQRDVIQKGLSKNNVFSVKIMSDQLMGISERFHTYYTQIDNALMLLPKVYNEMSEELFWVRIIRKNTIKQAISRVMATQTGVCHAVDQDSDKFFAENIINYNEIYNKDANYNYEEVIKEINNIKKEEILWNKFFTDNKIKPFRIVYEEAYEDTYDVIEKLAEVCGVDTSDVVRKEKKIKKLSNKLNKEWYKNTLQTYLINNKTISEKERYDLKELEKLASQLFVHGSL